MSRPQLIGDIASGPNVRLVDDASSLEGDAMGHGDRRKCKCCLRLFRPDPRNRRHQRYCATPRCKAASKADSQARWRAKPENQGYFSGPVNVARVQAWRACHPGSGFRRRLTAEPVVIDYETFCKIHDCHDRQGLTIAQTARALGLHPQTVATWVARARFEPRRRLR
jgi:hypothetical protein